MHFRKNNKDFYFTLSEGQKQMEDGSINWNVNNIRKQIVFDGTEESWRIISTTSTRRAFEILVDDIIPYTDGSVNPSLISNRFISISYNGTWKPGNISRWQDRKSIILIVNPDTDTATFKTWLATLYANGTPVIVEYELETPDETDFTNTQLQQYRKLCEAFPNETNLNDYLV